MKRFGFWFLALIIVAIVALPVIAAEQYFPNKNHTGTIGKAGRAWQGFYADYMYLYGGQAYYHLFSGTPTANRTLTLPDNTVTLSGYGCMASHDYASSSADWTLSASEAVCGLINVAGAGAAANIVVPAASSTYGKMYFIYNGSGQTITVKSSGATGSTIANGKRALYTVSTNDVWEIYEQS